MLLEVADGRRVQVYELLELLHFQRAFCIFSFPTMPFRVQSMDIFRSLMFGLAGAFLVSFVHRSQDDDDGFTSSERSDDFNTGDWNKKSLCFYIN
jgi:hypothetical protein